MSPDGNPGAVRLASLRPDQKTGSGFTILQEPHIDRLSLRFDQFIDELEDALEGTPRHHQVQDDREAALLISASRRGRREQEERLDELEALAASAEISVVGRTMQRMRNAHQRYLLGRGKLQDVFDEALHKGADMAVSIRLYRQVRSARLRKTRT
ncbi:MAG: hypothetical protein ICV75_03830 [Nitrospiraceae bacterium]|nr:hypothetical protein [Nitrospiraceae bacterium]